MPTPSQSQWVNRWRAFVPRIDPVPLYARLAKLRRALRWTAFVRGAALTLALPLGLTILLGWLDWELDIPPFVRVFGLVGLLTLTGILWLRCIVRPLQEPLDLQALALRLEEHFPELNDSLASTVDFLRQQELGQAWGSEELRRETMQRGLNNAEDHDFRAIVPSRALWRALLLLLVVVGGAVPLLLRFPLVAQTAVARLVDPFGGHRWTNIRILKPNEDSLLLARGNPFAFDVEFRGIIPETAKVSLWLDKAARPAEEFYPLQAPDPNDPKTTESSTGGVTSGPRTLTFRFEASQIPRSFRYRVSANDADTGWHPVRVAPPPRLVPLNGRQSPQLHLTYPAYTLLPATDLPAGSGIIPGWAGTLVQLRARVDRPVVDAHITFQPERPGQRFAAMLACLAGTHNPLGAEGLLLLSKDLWSPIPVELDQSRTLLRGTFRPPVRGFYQLAFTDEAGLTGQRILDARIESDPAPEVVLDRPSPAEDALLVTPAGEIPLQARFGDPQFGLRRTMLEYRLGAGEPRQAMPFFDGPALHAALNQAIHALSGVNLPGLGMRRFSIDRPRLQPRETYVEQRLAVRRFQHADGSPVVVGDTLRLWAMADDYDNVYLSKPPGRSRAIDLRIVSQSALEALLQKTLLDMRPALLEARERQREARSRIQRLLTKRNAGQPLEPADLGELAQTEQLQKQLEDRLADPQGGMKARIDRLKQAIRDNQLPPTPVTDRIDGAARQLGRLLRQDAKQILPQLREARQRLQLPEQLQPPRSEGERDALEQAEWHQRQVEEGLSGLLERLEPWSGAGAIRGEARELLNELRRLMERGRTLAAQLPPGMEPKQLPPDQRAGLEQSVRDQEQLAGQSRELSEKLMQQAQTKGQQLLQKRAEFATQQQQLEQSDSESTPELQKQRQEQLAKLRARVAALAKEQQALKQSLQQGATLLPDQLAQAADALRQGNLANAQQQQQQAAANLEQMIDSLVERPNAQSPDTLTKSSGSLQTQLQQLREQQDRLQKKMAAADQLADPTEREAQLQELAAEQQQLQRLTRRLREQFEQQNQPAVANALQNAEAQMQQNQQQLEQGEASAEIGQRLEQQLKEAQKAVEKPAEPDPDRLDREQAERVAAEIKALKERQQRANQERDRLLKKVLDQERWNRPLIPSLQDLSEQQLALADEVQTLIEREFTSAPVFERLLEHASLAMEQASERTEDWRLSALDALTGIPPLPFDAEAEKIAAKRIANRQDQATRRLSQLLEALKPPESPPEQAATPSAPGGQPPMPPGTPPENPQPKSPPLPDPAQLKALRLLQEELMERTRLFDRDHPDRNKLPEDAMQQLEALQAEQREIAELVIKMQEQLRSEGETP